VCASTIRATYAADGALDGPARLSIAYDGRFALVGWMRREEGGMSVFERRNGAWCRVANGGGVFTEADLVGFDGIDRATAHRLFTRLTRGGSPRGR
jgi:hypothetical protein